jgi:uncharacterized protein (UPF0276 family)
VASAKTPRPDVVKVPEECSGIGLRGPHHAEFLARRPAIGWVEVHAENHFARGGLQREVLAEISALYPLSLHGVGLSIGSTDALDTEHLAALARLTRDFAPVRVSEHLAWGSVDGRFTNDLLPLPYTEEALRHTAARVGIVQDVLGRQLLIENVSSYLEFNDSEMAEWEFLAALAAESGCALLLDVNNVYVNAKNHGFDPQLYLNFLPRSLVREIHLAGHSVTPMGARELLIDTHGSPVQDPVWELYGAALDRFGRIPSLIEWDTNLPPLEVLIGEARKIEQALAVRRAEAA